MLRGGERGQKFGVGEEALQRLPENRLLFFRPFAVVRSKNFSHALGRGVAIKLRFQRAQNAGAFAGFGVAAAQVFQFREPDAAPFGDAGQQPG